MQKFSDAELLLRAQQPSIMKCGCPKLEWTHRGILGWKFKRNRKENNNNNNDDNNNYISTIISLASRDNYVSSDKTKRI